MGIPVAYDALPSIADFELIRADIEQQLPLRNLHWVRQVGATRTIRTIQSLPLELRSLTSFGDSAFGPDLVQRPYLFVLFVICDDTEVYRATLRGQIREWLDSVTAKQHEEWLIVHVASGRTGAAKFYQRKGAIVDKVKADFNTGKKDRCIQVVQGTSAEDPAAWAEFLSKIKEGVMVTFDAHVGLYEENVRKADSQRQLDGWQFLPFLRQKEALAHSFEAMSLLEDALLQYDELEASFSRHWKEHADSPWFQNIGATAKGDGALPLLPTTAKQYHALVESGAISAFDLRVYLFARQASLLFQVGNPSEVARRGLIFIGEWARTLRQHQTSLGENFVESWAYSACLDIIESTHVRSSSSNGTQPAALEADLLELAKKQLEKIGMRTGHLPTTHPFCMSLDESWAKSPMPAPKPASSSTRLAVTRTDLLTAIESQDAFDELYANVTRRCVQAYQRSARRRCALKQHASISALEHHRGRSADAQKLYSQLPAHYTDSRWNSIEAYLLDQCARLQGDLNMPKDRLLSTLALIRAGMRNDGRRWALRPVSDAIQTGEDEQIGRAMLAEQLMSEVHRLSGFLNKDFAAVDFAAFSLRLNSDNGLRSSDQDVIKVVVIVHNALPCLVRTDEVRLKLSTTGGEQLWLTSGTCELQPGDNAIEIGGVTTVTGRLYLDLSQLRFSRIIFQYSHLRASSLTSASARPSIFLAQDHQAVRLSVEQPEAVHLDKNREFELVIGVGRHALLRLSLHLVLEHTGASLLTANVALIAGRCRLYIMNGGVVLDDLQPYETVKLRLPIQGLASEPSIGISVTAEYNTVRRPQSRRQLRQKFAYSMALPLAVNVQDYFRESCLLAKFSITTDGVQGIKVQSACLEAPSTVQVNPCRRASEQPVLVSPLQTANFLFRLVPHDTAVGKQELLRLVLKYSSSEDRLRSHALALVQSAIAQSTAAPCQRWISESFLAHALSSTPLESYTASESLSHLVYDEVAWTARADRCLVPAGSRSSVLAIAAKIGHEGSKADFWRTLEIPLALPSLHVLNLVRFEPVKLRIEIGQPLQAILAIRSSFRWCQEGARLPSMQDLSYEVMVEGEEWLVSGSSRGSFLAKEGNEVSLSLVLVPLRSGALFLPSVAVQAAPRAASRYVSCETQHITAATCVEVLPIAHRGSFEIRTPVVTH
ncbi:hypothetical protein JCM11641_001264 [Rhodosporidiobolus odoratus]